MCADLRMRGKAAQKCQPGLRAAGNQWIQIQKLTGTNAFWRLGSRRPVLGLLAFMT